MVEFIQQTNQNIMIFFIASIAAHMLIPSTFMVIMVWIYLISFIGHFANMFMEKPVLSLVLNIVQYIVVVIMLFAILIDDWCDFYMYRGNFVNAKMLQKLKNETRSG